MYCGVQCHARARSPRAWQVCVWARFVWPMPCVASARDGTNRFSNYVENIGMPKEKMNIAVSGDGKDSTFVHGD
ncbi:hypothetical protein QYE76_040878 [Lolium multiflorum]|uniref:Uncharacterized protein n=1 Tax=Lolium multiflorum TaxID=4521 RepID=A0AAD8TBX4_LOLMU|nr:hypothetical protein QYE76_040878 [Lolium multiflorum]